MLLLVIDPAQGKVADDGTVCRRLYAFQIAPFFPSKLFSNLFNFSFRGLHFFPFFSYLPEIHPSLSLTSCAAMHDDNL